MREATLLVLVRPLSQIVVGALATSFIAVAGAQTPASPPNVGSPQVDPPAQAVGSLEQLKARAKEIIELTVEGDATLVGAPGPVGVDFKDSKRVGLLVAEDLSRRGVPAIPTLGSTPTELRLSARVALRGPSGRLSFDLGTMFEKIIAGKSASEQAQVDPEQNVIFGATAYARTAGLERVGLFTPYLYRYFSAMSLADALGVHSAFNKAVTGDSRGVCLINCDNWNNTHHWVIVDAVVVRDGQERTARAVLKAWMTEVDPQTTFDIAYQALLEDRLLRKASP